MDRGDLLLVDLSGVGGDNASLFGAMLVSRYAIDAVGRTENPARATPPARPRDRRGAAVRHPGDGQDPGRGPEVRAVAAMATQSLDGLGDRLRSTFLSNTGSFAQPNPGREICDPSLS